MRNRERVLQSLEKVYRAAFAEADSASDTAQMSRLDLDYQRDQLQLEVLLDIRDVLTPMEEGQADKTISLLEKAQKRAEGMALRQRKGVLKTDNWLNEYLGFAGTEV